MSASPALTLSHFPLAQGCRNGAEKYSGADKTAVKGSPPRHSALPHPPPPPLLSFTGFYYNPPSKGQHGPVNMGQHSDGCGPSACVFPTPLKYPFESHTLC